MLTACLVRSSGVYCTVVLDGSAGLGVLGGGDWMVA
jgi:hypothetical protein